jgi:hypothetical protein
MALYDPQEFPAETRTDFSLPDVLTWARTKPADEAYDYLANCNCALAQFLRETGRSPSPWVTGFDWREGSFDGQRHQMPKVVADAVNAFPNTFGAFADRLEKVLAV